MDTKSLSYRRSVGPKSSLVTIFESTIVRAQPIELQTLCLGTLSEILGSEFCTDYSSS